MYNELSYNQIREKVKLAMINTGIYLDGVDEDFSNDLNLQSFIQDSLQFINFIVALEKELNLELQDDMLLYDKFLSFDAFCLELNDLF